METPDLIHPVTAFRWWYMDEDNIISPYSSFVWQTNNYQKVECTKNYLAYGLTSFQINHDKEEMPVKDCSCGWYSFNKFKDLIKDMKLIGYNKKFRKSKAAWALSRKQAKQSFRPIIDKTSLIPLIGIVEQWGKIEVHTRGLRSEKINLKAFIKSPMIYLILPILRIILSSAWLGMLIYISLYYGSSLTSLIFGSMFIIICGLFPLTQIYESFNQIKSLLKLKKQEKQISKKYNVPLIKWREIDKYNNFSLPSEFIPSLKDIPSVGKIKSPTIENSVKESLNPEK